MEHTFWFISLLSLHDDEMEFVIFVCFVELKLKTMIFLLGYRIQHLNKSLNLE